MRIHMQKNESKSSSNLKLSMHTSATNTKAGIIEKNKLSDLLQELSNEYSVFVPNEKNGVTSFKKLETGKTVIAEHSNSYLPPGKFFCFSPVWKKFSDFEFEEMDIANGEKAAIFGVRPCDANSLALLDKAIKDNDFYDARRKNTLLIVTGCSKPSKSCFCTSVNGSPFSSEAADIFLTDIGNYYIAENISNKLPDFHKYFSAVEDNVLKEKEKAIEKAERFLPNPIDMQNLPGKLEEIDKMEEADKNSVWKDLSGKCTNCGLCISLCPTCHCCLIVEDVMDLVVDEVGEEANKYDPCMVNIFVSRGLEGPVPNVSERIHRRVMDKFYHSAKNLGQPFCVGCGRCTEHCPENIDFKDKLEQLTTRS